MLNILLSTALIGCPVDCSRVLVAKDEHPRQAVQAVVNDVKKPDPDALIVKAYMEDEEGGMKSEVKCEVIKDTINCQW